MLMTTEPPPVRERVDPQALIEEARRLQRRRWRRIGTGMLALVVVVALVVTGIMHGHGRPSAPSGAAAVRSHRSPASTAGMPSAVVAWTDYNRLVVLSSRTGTYLRTLATNVEIASPGLPNLSVAADGMVYFDDSSQSGEDEIYRVPIGGGSARLVTAGYDPQVSPNGHELAFIAPEPGGQVPYLDPSGGLAIGQISPEGLTDLRILKPTEQQLNQGIMQLSWSPDSQQLSFDQLNGTLDRTSFWRIPVNRHVTSLGAARQIPLGSPSLTWNGYWGGHLAGVPDAGLGVLTSRNGTQKVVTINPATGLQVSTLFTVPGDVCVALSMSAPPLEGPGQVCSYQFNETVVGDTSGADVLIAGTTKFSPATGAKSAPALYRWNSRNGSIVRLQSGVDLATWGLPGS
jgi:hypothetical protein